MDLAERGSDGSSAGGGGVTFATGEGGDENGAGGTITNTTSGNGNANANGTPKEEFKNFALPLARIKKVMKSDPEVKMISAEVPVLLGKCCEIFIAELTSRAWLVAQSNKRRTLQKSDVAAAIGYSDMFDFLIDIVPREEAKGVGMDADGGKNNNTNNNNNVNNGTGGAVGGVTAAAVTGVKRKAAGDADDQAGTKRQREDEDESS
ncbi:histone-fold-containing protein [Filobasidium floriforme]|uniref:histone-fold-containing protein n=1 Tax=Filobasidium floriforme TaxID=5210 RepID=UPI001E8D1B92|nr:histone-fold-containing protein [Filobasidium floriforme]KAH8084198.1 histone-fold-containing protein [Filobasidium floriforme]